MKSMLTVAWIVGATAAPALSLAQDAPAPTRAQVQAQMRRPAGAGYRGRGDETSYPSDVQAAQLRAGERQQPPEAQEQGAPVDASGYGSQRGPRSESGARAPKGPASIYFGV